MSDGQTLSASGAGRKFLRALLIYGSSVGAAFAIVLIQQRLHEDDATGYVQEEMSDFIQQRVFEPIGITHASFSVLGGAGSIGPHTCGHVGLVISARDLARFGLLACRAGRWGDKQVIPQWWCELATRSSQPLNPEYGYSWWVNTSQTRWPELPPDTFALQGHNTNDCYVIPSLDMVVVKVGSGPTRWNEGDFVNGIIGSIR